jgi:hypothetical protein
MSTVKNAKMEKMLIIKKHRLKKTSNGKNVTEGTKGRIEKTLNLNTRELEYF